MKKIFLLAFLAISMQPAFSQNFAWVQSWGGPIWDYSRTAAIDSDGNVFVAGYFRNSMDADPGPAVVNLVGAGESDVFVSKFNASGKLLWAKQISGPMYESANAITTDAVGNVYITGVYFGLVDFNPGSGVFNLENSTSANTFVCKLDNDGNFIWAKAFNGGAPAAYSIAVDANQNVYTTGRFNALTDFDPGTGVYQLDALDYTDMFICKLDAAGGFVWAKQIAEVGDTAVIKPASIALDSDGNVLTTGSFHGTVDFDPGAGTALFTAIGEQSDVSFPKNVFVSKLDTDGNFVWAKSIGDASELESTDIAVDATDNVYLSGYFLETVDFDPGAGTSELTSGSMGANAFVCKFDPQGDFAWMKGFTGAAAALAQGIEIAGDEIYTTGYFNGPIDFDPASSSINFLLSEGETDVFVSKLDLDGNHLWSQKAGGLSNEIATAIAVDAATGNVFVTGYFEDTTDFNPSAETWEVASKGEWDAFLVKFSECVPSNGLVELAHTCNDYVWQENGAVYTSSGIYWNILTSSTGCDSTVKLDLTLWDFEGVVSMNLFGDLIVSQANTFIDEYKWINCETFEVVGTEGSYHVPTAGFYGLISTSGNCIDTSECVYVEFFGLDELASAGLSLYPNPVSDQLTFQSADALQSFGIEITSVSGQLVYNGMHVNGDQIPVEKWPAGIYVAKIVSGEKWYVTRIVKQ